MRIIERDVSFNQNDKKESDSLDFTFPNPLNNFLCASWFTEDAFTEDNLENMESLLDKFHAFFTFFQR